jgi:hypothetical protein
MNTEDEQVFVFPRRWCPAGNQRPRPKFFKIGKTTLNRGILFRNLPTRAASKITLLRDNIPILKQAKAEYAKLQ